MKFLFNTKLIILFLLLIIIIESAALYFGSKPENNFLLPPFDFGDSAWEDGYFSANGSWISDTKLANPIQTINIECFKDWGYCNESMSQLSDGNFLYLTNTLYTIKEWGSQKIITESEPSLLNCVTNDLVIDRARKQVISTRITIENTESLCEGIEDKPIISKLGDGMDRIRQIQEQK